MFTEPDIGCTISCPNPPEEFEALFLLCYKADYTSDGIRKQSRYEKEFRINKGQSYFVRFSDGSIIRFGDIPRFEAWTNVLKRNLGRREVEGDWGYNICEVKPTMGYSYGPAWPKLGQGYSGNELRLEFEGPLTAIDVSTNYFSSSGGFLTYQIALPESKEGPQL